MIFKGNRDKVFALFSTPSGIPQKTNTIPILSNLLVRKNGTSVSVLGSDVTQEMSTFSEFEEVGDDDSFTVSSKKVVEILKSLPSESDVVFERKDSGRILMKSGRSRFTLASLEVDTFPLIQAPPSYTTVFSVNASVLGDAINRVSFCTDPSHLKPFAQGIHLSVSSKGSMDLSATNASSLAHCKSQCSFLTGEDVVVIIPLKSMSELYKLSKKNPDLEVKVSVAQNQVKFEADGFSLSSKVIEDRFPDVAGLINESRGIKALVDAEKFEQILSLATVLIEDKIKGVTLDFAEDSLIVTSRNSSAEDTHLEMDIDGGDRLTISLNASFVSGFLNVCKANYFEINLKSENSSVLFRDEGDDNYAYVLMPMRI